MDSKIPPTQKLTPTEHNIESRGPSILRSALSMAVGTFSSRILGLVRDVISYTFFDRTVTDAFAVAFRLPNMFRRLMGEGSLTVSFVPIYTENREHDRASGGKSRHQFSDSVWTYTVLVSLVLCFFGIIYMPEIIELWVGEKGFQQVAGKLELTITFARIMFSFLFFITAYAYLQALSQANRFFFMPAFAPVLFNVAMISSAILARKEFGFSIEVLAWGVVVGGFLQALVVAVQLYRHDLFPKFSLKRNVPGFARMWQNMLPGIVGLGGLQILTTVNTHFASRLPEGALSYTYLADRILELPQALIAVSLGSALLPPMTERFVRGEMDQLQQLVVRYLRLMLYLSIPSAIGMYFLAKPIVEVLFYRGEFNLNDLEGTASVVQIYSFLLLATSSTKVVVTAFYAAKNTWLPAAASFGTSVAHVFVADWATRHFGLQGLVASTAFTSFLNVVVVMVFYQSMIGKFRYWELLKGLVQWAPAYIALGFFLKYSHDPLLEFLETLVPRFIASTVALFAVIGVGMVIYFAISKLVKVDEMEELFRRIRNRRRAKAG